MTSTRLKVYQVVYDPTSKRVVKDERACFRLKIEDSLKAVSYWSEPITPTELSTILGADQPQTEPTGISVATALLTSAAFNFQSKSDPDGARSAGEPAVIKRPTAEGSQFGTPGAKWIGDVRVRRLEPTRAALKALGVKADKHGPLTKERSDSAPRQETAAKREATKKAADELWEELGLTPKAAIVISELIKKETVK